MSPRRGNDAGGLGAGLLGRGLPVAGTVAALLLRASPLWAQGNPFVPGFSPGGDRIVLGAAALPLLASLQRGLQGRLADLLASGHGIALLLLAATAYGVIHALGPGHQKTLLAGYFLSERTGPGRVAGAAFLTAALHAGSSVLLVGGIALLLERFSTGTFERTRMLIQRGSGLVLVGMAAWMLILRVRLALHRLRGHGGGAGQGHDPEEECPLCARAERARRDGRSLLGIVLLGGLVPCPGAAMLVLFGLSSGHPGLGVTAVAALSAGMGLTLLAVGLAARFFREEVERGIRSERRKDWVRSILEVGGSLLVLLFALALTL